MNKLSNDKIYMLIIHRDKEVYKTAILGYHNLPSKRVTRLIDLFVTVLNVKLSIVIPLVDSLSKPLLANPLSILNAGGL